MLDINLIRQNPDIVIKSLKKRRDSEKIKWVDNIIKIDSGWRKNKINVDNLRHRRNELSLKINEDKKRGKNISKLIKESGEIPEKIKKLEQKMNKQQEEIRYYLMRLPNILGESVPYGKDENDNVEIKRVGRIKKFKYPLRVHGELIESLGIADFKRGVKISGAGFYFLKGDLALLDQALMRYGIDHMLRKGHTLIEPPLMMNRKSYEGVTDIEDFKNVMYKIDNEDLYLIATSEHPMVSMHMDEVIDENCLPIKYVGVSPCFRKEIGSRGVDTKGLFRVHQFNKIEQVILCEQKDSWKFLKDMLKNTEDLFKSLQIPYRIVNICTGDIGIVAAQKYDIEAWYPRENKYSEVGSISNCTAYQSVRLNIKCSGKKRGFIHTLNGTAIATSRALRAIIENNQQKDGSIKIPKVLINYMNGKGMIKSV